MTRPIAPTLTAVLSACHADDPSHDERLSYANVRQARREFEALLADLAEALALIRWLTEEGAGYGEFECGHGFGVLSRRCDARGCMGARVYDLMQRLSPRSPRARITR